MTNKEILEQAISKAKQNGWKPPYWIDEISHFRGMHFANVDIRKDGQNFRREADYLKPEFFAYNFIFNHDFVKALWVQNSADYEELGDELWKDRLREMVLADDPIAYLGEHLDG